MPFNSDSLERAGEREKERGGERERRRVGRERERPSSLLQSVRFFSFFYFSPLILFHVMGLVLRRRNGTEKNTLLLLLLLFE